jgi:hypothetical protein
MLSRIAALFLGLSCLHVGAATVPPVQFGGLQYITQHFTSGTTFDEFSGGLGSPTENAALLGTDIHESHGQGFAVVRWAAVAAFQLPDFGPAPSSFQVPFGGVRLTATIGSGSVSVWDLVNPLPLSIATYTDATSGVRYGGLSPTNPPFESTVSSFLDAAVYSDLFAHSGGLFYMGFSGDRLSSIRNVSLEFFPGTAVVAPLPPAGWLFLSALGLLGVWRSARSKMQ